MKIVFKTQELLSALASASKIVLSGKAPRVSLRCVWLKPGKDTVTLSASDLETFLNQTISATVTDGFSVLIPFQLFNGVVSECKDESIELGADTPQTVWMKTSTGHFKINCCTESDFPETPTPESAVGKVTLLPTEFSKAIVKAMVETAKEDSRYAINGVLLNTSPKKLTVGASSGNAIFRAQVKASPDAKCKDVFDKRTVIVPVKAAGTLATLCENANGDEDIEVSASGRNLFAKVGNAEMCSLLIDGTFPNIDSVIDDNKKVQDREATLNKEAFATAIRQVGYVVSEEETAAIIIELKDGVCYVRTESQRGKSDLTLPVTYTGEAYIFRAKLDYLKKGLAVITGEHAVMVFGENNKKPISFREGQNLVYLFMPMEIK